MGFQDGTRELQSGEGYFASPAGFPCFSQSRKTTNKGQHLCQMGAGWNSCVPQVLKNGKLSTP